MRKNIGKLSKSSLEFLDYLSSDYGKEHLHKNKLKIHLESGEIFHDNVNTGENFYNFFSDQEFCRLKFKSERRFGILHKRNFMIGLNFVKM